MQDEGGVPTLTATSLWKREEMFSFSPTKNERFYEQFYERIYELFVFVCGGREMSVNQGLSSTLNLLS